MNLVSRKPELVQGVNAQIQTGHFHSVEEVIERALDALEEQAPVTVASGNGAVVLAGFQASPYPDIDFTPPRVRLSNVRNVVL